MQDKYINATKLIERLKCEKRREVAEAASNPFSTGPAPEIRISQIYDGVVSVLERNRRQMWFRALLQSGRYARIAVGQWSIVEKKTRTELSGSGIRARTAITSSVQEECWQEKKHGRNDK